jgi:hypothetical protein
VATYIDAKGSDRLKGWLPADAVAEDRAEPVALADWLGHWHHSENVHDGHTYVEGDITVKAGKAGGIQIEGAANNWSKGSVAARPSAIKTDVTPDGDRLRFAGDGCVVWMQRLGPWLIVRDNDFCGGGGDSENATFQGVYTRMPLAGIGEAAVAADGVTPIGYFELKNAGDGTCRGYSIYLWRTAETVVGRYYSCKRDRYDGLITQVSYDQKTGHLTFTARLSELIGPVKDVVTFDGRLATTDVTGTLKHVDESHPERGAKSERIALKKPKKEEERDWMTLKSYCGPRRLA